MQILGADIGFGFTKAVDGRRSQVFKSVVGEAADVQFDEALLDTKTQYPRHIEIEGESFFVGELAEQQSRGRGFTLDPQQFVTKYARPLALTAIAPFVEDGNPVRLVTGLPISFFRKQRGALTQVLQKRHMVALVDADGNRIEKNIQIDRVQVIPQPFGSVFNLMLNELGKPASQRFMTEKVGVIDVGFRTADYTISDKTKYLERGSLSSDSGISAAYTAIANLLHEKSGVNVELYRLYDAVSKGVIKIRGKRYDLTKIVQKAFTHLASKIAADVNRLWTDDWDIDAIILTGGGGKVLAPYLQPLVEGEVIPLADEVDARMNNVSGYWKYGMHMWSGSKGGDTAG